MSARSASVSTTAASSAAAAIATRTAGDARRGPTRIRELLESGAARRTALPPAGGVLGSGEAEVIGEPSSLARSASLVERCTAELANRWRFVVDDTPRRRG